jgi:hypothetical protein
MHAGVLCAPRCQDISNQQQQPLSDGSNDVCCGISQTAYLAACAVLCAWCRLCELNVLRQVFHVATSPVVASAWSEGQELHVYGLIYDVADGHLRKLAGPIRWGTCVGVRACVPGVCC